MRLLREGGDPHPPPVTSPKPQVRKDDLGELVEEAAHLADERAATLNDAEVRDVLRQLDVPEDLAAQAHDRVLEKRGEARKKAQRRWLLGGAVAIALTFAGGVAMVAQERASLVAGVESDAARLSVGKDGPDVTTFRAEDRPDVYLSTTLRNAPTGQSLDLRCDFRDPSGKVARQVSYTTKRIDTPVWPTHCHYVLPSSAAKGDWSVDLVLEQKTVRRERFRVE